MADGLSSAAADVSLNQLAATYSWVQLHTAAPGSAGTTAVATNNTRKQVTWATSSGNSLASSADAAWTAVPATETYSHFTVWTASTSGVFGFSGAVTNGAVSSGNDFKIASGSLTASFTLAS